MNSLVWSTSSEELQKIKGDPLYIVECLSQGGLAPTAGLLFREPQGERKKGRWEKVRVLEVFVAKKNGNKNK